MSATTSEEFAGTARFAIRRRIGAGGMGVVYQATDRERGVEVALKTIGRSDPLTLYRFKKEFRALEDVSHPNLVRLWELFAEGDDWFFTMELVDGTDFLRHVLDPADPAPGPAPRPPEGDPATAEGTADFVLVGDPATAAAPAPRGALDPTRAGPISRPAARASGPAEAARRFDEGRLRPALGQLARALVALHSMGRLHRDIKASNVMVDRRGRVVVLDFGLSIELAVQDDTQATENQVAGTVAYMAPEQAMGEPLTPASDWYSVGVLLYQALTGRLPFPGSSLKTLLAKQVEDPPPPWALADDLPTDLSLLCVDLLRRSPEARPTGEDVLRRLGESAEPAPSRDATPGAARPFLGRDSQLRALREAYAAAREGRAVAVFLQGRSGAGKSALARHFLGQLDHADGAVVLHGRCFEQESVAFKAMDSLIDALASHLRRLPRLEVEAILPRDIAVLAQVFPVLRRVESVAAAPQRAVGVLDPQELRRRAFAALREMLARIGDRGPLVLVIDDLQWGDLDSAEVLTGLLRPPDAPALLLLCCYRSEYVHTSRCLVRLLVTGEDGTAGLDRVELDVDALSQDEARGLARLWLRDVAEVPDGLVDLIARESGGSPYYVAELARYLIEGREIVEGGEGPASLRLDDVLWRRIQALPPKPRRLLEAIAVAGRPLGQASACRAAGLGTDGYAALARLRADHLVHGKGPGVLDEVEAFHDRVRETVANRLTAAERRAWHAALAAELEESGAADPETLAVHFEGAGDRARATHYCEQAAVNAAAALAFDRAAELYRRTLELRGHDRDAGPIWEQLALALANAGRGAEAARAFGEAAARSSPTEAVALRGRAASQFLMSGHIDEGLEVFAAILAQVGMRRPRTPVESLACVLIERFLLAARGLRLGRPRGDAPASLLTRVDVARGVALGMSVVDVIQGAYYQTRSLRLAFKSGDRRRIALALGWEAVHSASQGRPARNRTRRLVGLAGRVAAEVDDPHAVGMAILADGSDDYFNSRFPRAVPTLARAATVFRDRCTGVTWELDTSQTFATWALLYMGELAEMSGRFQAFHREARARGDRYMASTMGVYPGAIARLAADEPGEARELADSSINDWSRTGFHVQHLNHFYGLMYIHLHEQDGPAAWDLAERTLPRLRRSLLTRVEHVAIDCLQLRVRAALAAATTANDPAPMLAAARTLARQLARRRTTWGRPVATLARAGVAHLRGDRDAAVELLRAGADQAEAMALGLFAAAARRHLGTLIGGDEGRAGVERADAWMAAREIKNPERMAHGYLPGFAARR